MMHTYKRITAALTALAVFLSVSLPAAAEAMEEITAADTVTATFDADGDYAGETAAPSYPDRLGGFGSVTSMTECALGGAATLTRYENRADGEIVQTAFAVTASPADGARIAAVNLGADLHSREKPSSLLQTAANEGETLTAAVNADFFSLYTGVPMGVLIADGRLLSSSDGRDAVGFAADGSAIFGKIGETVTVEVDGESLAISHVNKYPSVYGVYLLTRDYGATTTQKGYAATEYVLRTDGALTLGGTVEAEVVAVRASAENADIPEDCAVLIVPDAFASSAAYAALTVGETVVLRIACESGFTEAVSALGGGDILLQGGATVDGIADEDHEKTRQPRTALGVCADGSYLLFVADGRQTGYSSGLTLTALADTLLALGCTDAVNFDGGGSTALVTFASGTATVQNRPSDGSERKVANAAALYEEDAVAAKACRLTLAQDVPLLLAGATFPIAAVLQNGAGETLPHTLTTENTTITVSDALGTATLADGEILFTPAAVTGGGILTVETVCEGKMLRASCYLRVTDHVETLFADETLLLAEAGDNAVLTVRAYTGGEEVFFGDRATVECDNAAIDCVQSGTAFRFAAGGFAPEDEIDNGPESEADSKDEPSAVRGRITLTLAGQTLTVPVLFGEPQTPLKLDGLLWDHSAVSGGDYTLSYETDGGIVGGGAFVLTPRYETETTETAEATTEPVVATEATEFADPAAAESAETTESVDPAEMPEMTDSAEPDETAESAETAERTEPTEDTAPTDVALCVGGLASAGLAGRRLWLWADGISAARVPEAVFTLIRADGGTETLRMPYEAYYDFADYNGRVLLTLVPEAEDGILSLQTLLDFSVTDPTRTVSIGPLLLVEGYDTNRYADLVDHWASYFVNALTFGGIVGGSEDLTGKVVYNPDESLSREQFAKILCGILQLDTAAETEAALPFADTERIAKWAVPYVRAVFAAGLMRGRDMPDGTLCFAPQDAITREEAFYVLGGLIGGADENDLPESFADADSVAPWAAEMLWRSVAAGLVSGYADGTVRPQGRITRAETATVVVRLLGHMRKIDAKG